MLTALVFIFGKNCRFRPHLSPICAFTRTGASILTPHVSVPAHLQTWCRGAKTWESETLCLDCHSFSWRSYKDPDFATPEEHEKRRWQTLAAAGRA